MELTFKPIDQQVIVITGASSGIGLATAQAALARGARVVVSARSAGNLASFVSAAGEQAAAFIADVADAARVRRLAEHAISRFGRIDTWVNNAGVSIYGRIQEVSDIDNRRLFDTNFWGVVNGSLTALAYMSSKGGALINVGSEVSEAVVPLQGMYSASKHAVKGFTDALRVELESDGVPVSVTLIQPTAVDTPFPQHARNYLNREPKLPDPKIEPAAVAEAILKAATSQQRDMKVGGTAVLNTVISKIAPSIADRMAARMIDAQQHNLPPRDPAGALHQARGGGCTHGQIPTTNH